MWCACRNSRPLTRAFPKRQSATRAMAPSGMGRRASTAWRSWPEMRSPGNCGAACPAIPTTPTVAIWKPKRSEEHTSELQSLMRISYAVFCLKKKKNTKNNKTPDKRKNHNIEHQLHQHMTIYTQYQNKCES